MQHLTGKWRAWTLIATAVSGLVLGAVTVGVFDRTLVHPGIAPILRAMLDGYDLRQALD